jgi:phosphoribosylformylglycinamidine synthase
MARIGFAAPKQPILLVGCPPARGEHLGQSFYLRDLFGRVEGPPPPVDLDHEKRAGDFVRSLIRRGIATAVHDLSDGGLAVALAEMAMASGIGATAATVVGHSPAALWFGEDQGRYLVTVALDPNRDDEAMDALWAEAKAAGLFAPWIGTTGGDSLILEGTRPLLVSELRAAHESWFPSYMAG